MTEGNGSENELVKDKADLVSVRLVRIYTDPVVLPHPSSTIPSNALQEFIIPQRFALLDEAGDEPVDVATWPETVFWISERSLVDANMASGAEAKMYGYAFSRFVEVCGVTEKHERLLESVSAIVPENPPDQILRKITKLRRKIRQKQHEKFLEDVYPELDTDVPKSFWKTDGPVTGYPTETSQ